MNIKDFFNLYLPYIIIVFVAAAAFFLGRLLQKFKDLKKIREERSDAIKRSRAVLGGQFAEQLAPYFPDFPCNPGDAHFLGKPVDYVAFPGSAENLPVEEVLFIEIKSGTSMLSEREKQIRAAVQKGNVRYVEYRLPLLS
ncbi:MAG: Holliday junction resolvase [Treponema sp.]|nr:Holliday junction resolvase [Treponema sp.]